MNEPRPAKPRAAPRPSFRDWALLSISLAFVVGSLFILPRDPRGALMPLTFFSVCALTFGYNIFRKLRRRRFAATAVRVPGGVKLRGSSSRTLFLAGLIAVPGVAIFLMPAPLLIQVCGAIMLGASALLLFLVLTGRVARRFLRFDPLGLTIGETNYEYVIPWDVIDGLAEYEMHSNAVVGFDVGEPDAMLVRPESMRPRVLKTMGRNQAFGGRHVVIIALQFGVPAESLCAAIATYVTNREARSELVTKPSLAAPE